MERDIVAYFKQFDVHHQPSIECMLGRIEGMLNRGDCRRDPIDGNNDVIDELLVGDPNAWFLIVSHFKLRGNGRRFRNIIN